MQECKPWADEDGEGERKTVQWLRKLADMARGKDRAARLQAALLMRQTFLNCSVAMLPRLQVVSVGVLLALVRQASTAWDCAAMALGALSALEQGLWRLGADAGGHREAAQLLGRYLPDGLKATAALAGANGSDEAGTGGSMRSSEEAAVVEAVLAAVESTLQQQPSALRPHYAHIVGIAAEHLGHPLAHLRHRG